ncbi:MAG: DinB family protein [Chloroflexi bacterium]|nr:DinB family protein [Chloroflexota bacterium]MBI3170132.1 DinB family protein [Chloroflexota bacterium]
MQTELVKTFITYHIDTSRRVWDLIDTITDDQFLADEIYSHGSIRNLMVHLASVDRRWLAGLKNLDDVGHLKEEDYTTRAAAREIFESVAKNLSVYVSTLTEEALNKPTDKVEQPQWQILLHLVNHGTDHRATVLQRLNELDAKTFPQDFVMWLWERK